MFISYIMYIFFIFHININKYLYDNCAMHYDKCKLHSNNIISDKLFCNFRHKKRYLF